MRLAQRPSRVSRLTRAVAFSLAGVFLSVAVDATPPEVHERVLHVFQGGTSDGDGPLGGLIADKSGALYGTTTGGGDPGNPSCKIGCGTVFKLIPHGSRYVESILYKFQNGTDGSRPWAGVIADSSGSLYGTVANGGSGGCGTVFKLTPTGSGYTETTLHAFQGGGDGCAPVASLTSDVRGALYGTTYAGGNRSGWGSFYGYGTVFKLTPSGSGYKESILYAFKSRANDGDGPRGNLVIDARGALYGTTFWGGPQGNGAVFKLTPNGSGYRESILHLFSGYDGQWPGAGLIRDNGGALYGTTLSGGTAPCRRDGHCGTAFKLTPSRTGYAITVLHDFQGGDKDGADSMAPLMEDASGALYGTTSAGGRKRGGTIFELVPSGAGYTERVLFEFVLPGFGKGSLRGAQPVAGLIADDKGDLYGTTSNGGCCGGNVFKLSTNLKVHPAAAGP